MLPSVVSEGVKGRLSEYTLSSCPRVLELEEDDG